VEKSVTIDKLQIKCHALIPASFILF